MGLLRNLVIIALILLLVLIALQIVLPIITWVFKLALGFILLAAISLTIIYLYRKLRA